MEGSELLDNAAVTKVVKAGSGSATLDGVALEDSSG
jgi:hypothetical protein